MREVAVRVVAALRRHPDRAAIGLLLVLTGVTALSHFGIQQRLYDLDTLIFYIPWYGFLGERLRAFDIPGWMPHQFSGTLFAADPQSGWMYLPAMLSFALLPGVVAQTAFIIFHWLLAGLSTYALARTLGMRAGSALVGATAMEFGPFMEHTHRSLLRSQLSAWLPLALLGIELGLRASRRSSRGAASCLTGIALSQVMGAWIGQGAYLALLVVGSYLAYRTMVSPPPILRTWRDRTLHLVFEGAVMLAVAFGLAAAGLLPRLEWNSRTNLAGGAYDSVTSVQGRGWSASLLIDRLLSYEDGRLYWYVGWTALSLALLAVIVAGRRFVLPYFALVMVLTLALTLDKGPVHHLFFLLPAFETLHEHQPNRVLVLLSLTVPLLAAAAVNERPRWSRGQFAPAVALVPLTAFTGVVLVLHADGGRLGAPSWNAMGATALLLLMAGLASAGRSLPRLRWLWPTTEVALPVAFALLIWWDPTGSAIVRTLRDRPDNPIATRALAVYPATTDSDGPAAFLQQARAEGAPFRSFGFDETHWIQEKSRLAYGYTSRYDEPAVVDLITPPRAIRLGLDDIQGYNPVHVRRYDEFMTALNGKTQNYHVSEVLQGGIASPLLDVLNARFIIVPSGVNGGWDGAELIKVGAADAEVYADDRVRILERRSALPRAWIVHETRQVEPGQALDLLADGTVDPRLVAVIEEEPPPLVVPSEAADETVTVLPSKSPDRIRLVVRANAAGLVVLSEVYDRGWRAYVNGEQTPIQVADHILRSVPVAAGDSVIELRFEPRALRVGVVISAGTLAAVVAVIAVSIRPTVSRRWRRRTGPATARGPRLPSTLRSVSTSVPWDRPGYRPGIDRLSRSIFLRSVGQQREKAAAAPRRTGTREGAC